MKRIFVLMVLVLCGLAFGQRAIEPGATDVRFIVMLRTSAGVPVTDLADEGDGVNSTLRMSFAPTYAKASAIGVAQAYWNGTDGLLHCETTAANGHVDGTVFPLGLGKYRIDAPDAFWDFNVKTEVTVTIEDTSAEAMQCDILFMVGPPVDSVRANGDPLPTSPANLSEEFARIQAHTDYIPSVSTGSPGAILIAGGNAETIFGSTTFGTTDLFGEVAKIPKSDSTVSWNSTALGAIADAILAKALTVPTAGASPDTPTLDQALSWLYSRWFNKSVTTTTEFQLFKRNETDKIYEQDFSDDGSELTVGEAKVAD